MEKRGLGWDPVPVEGEVFPAGWQSLLSGVRQWLFYHCHEERVLKYWQRETKKVGLDCVSEHVRPFPLSFPINNLSSTRNTIIPQYILCKFNLCWNAGAMFVASCRAIKSCASQHGHGRYKVPSHDLTENILLTVQIKANNRSCNCVVKVLRY